MRSEGSRTGRRPAPLALVCLTIFLLLLPLTLTKPGLPVVLKADEAAYYLASLSLWHDGDVVCDDGDARRLFREFSGTDNLILMSGGPGEPVYFGIPLVYPLLATPFVALFGANGMVLLNAALLAAMLWMGFAYLRRHNEEPLAALFAAGFVLLSTAFVYVFWLQAEVFNMACVMAAFYLAERAVGGLDGGECSAESSWRLPFHAAGSAALLATVGYGKPMLAALALPILFLLYRARSWRGLGAFAACGLLSAVFLAGTAYATSGQIWPYFANRVGVPLSSPVDFIERKVDPHLEQETVAVAPSGKIGRAGRELRFTMAATLIQAAPEFLVGRHGGFLLYMPFAVLAIVLFLINDRRSLFGWLILASALVTAVLFVSLVRGQWLGGGGFIGNRYFSAVYPSFLFLVQRVRPSWLTALGFAAGAVFLGPLLVTPLGAPVIEPTLQAHVRNQPFPRMPLEWSLVRNLPGYREVARAGVSFHARRDETWAYGEEIWILGAKRVELNLLSPEPTRSFAFDLRNLAPDNQTEICLQEDCRRLDFHEVPMMGRVERLTFGPLDGEKIPRAGRKHDTYRYRLSVETRWGEQSRWRGSGGQRFYLGAALLFLGSPEDLTAEPDEGGWLEARLRRPIEAGGNVRVPVTIRNPSPEFWPSTGPYRVKIGHRWLSSEGQPLGPPGDAAQLPDPLAAGRELEARIPVRAPRTAGRYLLAFDLRRPWLADEDPWTHAVEVVVVAATGAPRG